MVKNIYLISGLGADERAFIRLDLKDYAVHYIQWIRPEKKESIKSYAHRLKKQITTPNPILIGLSFGGIIALEIEQLMEVEKIILLSSVKTKKEIPLYFRIAGCLRLDKLLPQKKLKRSRFLAHWFIGTKSIKEKSMLNEVLKDADPVFMKWQWVKSLVGKTLNPILQYFTFMEVRIKSFR